MFTRICNRYRCRGTAEIELLFVIGLVFIPFLILLGGTRNSSTPSGLSDFGTVRLANVSDAEFRGKELSAIQPAGAYAQVITGDNDNIPLIVHPSNTAIPINGINIVRPSLPNRFYEASLSREIRKLVGSDSVTIRDQAIFLNPSWDYASWPQGHNGQSDRLDYQAWFENYAGEDHPSDLVNSLGLQPSWPP